MLCVCASYVFIDEAYSRKTLSISHLPAGLAIEVVLSHRLMRYFTESQRLLQSFTQAVGTKNNLGITN